jgi:DNA repair exonuclease SbcCD ATPase subunit
MSDTKDYLYEDPAVPNQKFVCISILTPKNFKDPKETMSTLKVRGSYDSFEEASKRGEFLRNIDPHINVYVGEVGKWLPFDDDPEKAKQQEYQNKQLNNLMKGYMENQEKAKEFHEQRKNELILKTLKENEDKEKRRTARDERRKKGEVVDDDAEESAFQKELREREKKGVSVEMIEDDSNQNKVKAEDKSQVFDEKEKDIKAKENEVKEEKAKLQQTTDEYNKYKSKTEKIRKELDEARETFNALLAAGSKNVEGK